MAAFQSHPNESLVLFHLSAPLPSRFSFTFRLASSQSSPSITRVSGCRDVGNSTANCNTGVVLTVFGGPFSSVSVVLLASHYSCPILSSSSTNVTCKLPPISVDDDEGSYLNVSVQLTDQPPVLFDGAGRVLDGRAGHIFGEWLSAACCDTH